MSGSLIDLKVGVGTGDGIVGVTNGVGRTVVIGVFAIGVGVSVRPPGATVGVATGVGVCVGVIVGAATGTGVGVDAVAVVATGAGVCVDAVAWVAAGAGVCVDEVAWVAAG